LSFFGSNLPSPSSLFGAVKNSLAGLRAARKQRAFGQELALFALVIPTALWAGRDHVERALLIGSWLLVMIVELLNSAIETAVDRVGFEPNELAGRAKDLGSAAVFMAIVLHLVIWLFVLTGS
jgi:diacylglycerol kinase (ATP)